MWCSTWAKCRSWAHSGLRVLLNVRAKTRRHSGDLHLACLQEPPAARLLTTTGARPVLTVHRSVEQAILAALHASEPTGRGEMLGWLSAYSLMRRGEYEKRAELSEALRLATIRSASRPPSGDRRSLPHCVVR
ncbi:hypothetical protein [Nonomuraea sp. NPDC049709]|uniref:hypothetical protein n=1 Tax=Nonomuraea sp. NPDC049709 TaxID=3154736 RepID=UPI00342A3510